MIKKLDIYMSKNFIKYFLMSSISFLGIFLLAQMFRIVKYINQGKLVGIDIYKYIISLIPKIFIDIAPLSVLLSGLIIISIMASNLEIISLKTAGIKFSRIIRAPLIISFFISIFVFYVNNSLYTRSLITINKLRGHTTIENINLPAKKNNAFYKNTNKECLYFIKEINRKTGMANTMEIIKYKNNIANAREIITAKKGKYNFEEKIWELKDVHIYNIKTQKIKHFKNYKKKIYSDSPDNFIKLTGLDPRMQDIKGLKKSIREQRNIGEDSKIYLNELAKRYSYPFASFIIAFLGLSFGSKYVRGTKSNLNLIICVVAGYGYYLLSSSFEAMSINGMINPFIASWIPNIFYLLVGLYFMNKAEY
ncbi:MAG: permease [Fusobacteriales bacterium]|nr:MAG: permease [Fusobacteriales bacterium]